jgi:hypothetical protein
MPDIGHDLTAKGLKDGIVRRLSADDMAEMMRQG